MDINTGRLAAVYMPIVAYMMAIGMTLYAK